MKVEVNTKFTPGRVWTDTEGDVINAHGGGMCCHEGFYYWFGEIRDGKRRFAGVSCYTSTDLLNWVNQGIALASTDGDGADDLHYDQVVERPKVIYNEQTRTFIMWMHIDDKHYKKARVGIATSLHPQGPYTYISSFRPNGAESRDMTVYKDDDGKAYLIQAAEGNATLYIHQLTDDYLGVTTLYTRALENQYREAPAVYKSGEQYVLITSGTTGFSPNRSAYAVSRSMFGPWKACGDPCVGRGAESTFHSQPTYVIPVADRPGTFILMADHWRARNLPTSTYVWLPIAERDRMIEIRWLQEWSFMSQVEGHYTELPTGEPITIPYTACSPDITKQPQVEVKHEGNGMSFAAWLGWKEELLYANVLVRRPAHRPVDASRPIWDQDSVEVWINYLQLAVGFTEEGHAVVCGGAGSDQIVGISDVVRAELEWGGTSHEGQLYRIEIWNIEGVMQPFRQGESLALAVTVNAAPAEGSDDRKQQVSSPPLHKWADTDTYHAAMLR